MDKVKLDALDKRIIKELSKNGRVSITELAKHLNITDPTARTRLNRLIGSGILQVTGLVNFFRVKGVSLAIIAITIDDHRFLDRILERVSKLPLVNWVAVVTGRYDLVCEVTIPYEATDRLYWFLTKELSRIEGIREFETSIVLKAERNWISVPKSLGEWFEKGEVER
jgi:Lrp/AsnC family transcriptional regulator for asnA, asnC and gidA